MTTHTIKQVAARLLLAALAAMMAIGPVRAQTYTLNQSVQVLPPYTNKLSDYFAPGKIISTITISDAASHNRPEARLAIRGYIQSVDNDGAIQVGTNEQMGHRVIIRGTVPPTGAPGTFPPYTLTYHDIQGIFTERALSYQGITREQVMRDGLPAGMYRICFEITDDVYRASDTNFTRPQPARQGSYGPFCSAPFTITPAMAGEAEPPIIINPANNSRLNPEQKQSLQFNWTMPGGAAAGTHYKLRIIEVSDPGMNYRDMLHDDRYPAFFETTVGAAPMYLYTTANPPFKEDKTYAFVVQAFSAIGTTPVNFKNNGYSEVAMFGFKEDETAPPFDSSIIVYTSGEVPVNCSCKEEPSGTGEAEIKEGDVVTIGGGFPMTISEVKPDGSGGYNGKGTVPIPMIGNVPGLKLRVNFFNLKVHGNKRMYQGLVRGIRKNGAPSCIPTTDKPDMPNVVLNSDNIKEVDTYLKKQGEQLISNIKKSVSSIGFELPLGLDQGSVTIAVTEIYFTSKQAWFNSSGVMDISDGNTRLALAGKGFCVSEKDGFCKDGILALKEDFNIDKINLKLKASGSDDLTEGTYIAFNGDGFKELGIKAEYTFDRLIQVDNPNTPATATLFAKTKEGWGNWIAEGEITPFYVEGIPDFKFSLPDGGDGGKIIYDHSDVHNSTGMPNGLDFGVGQSLTFNNNWKGFYIPEMTMELPAAIKNIKNTPITVGVQHLIYDSRGFSAKIGAFDVLNIDDGSLDGWYFSVDNISVNFFRSSMIGGEMKGKVMLPISGKREEGDNSKKEIAYSCNLSKPSNAGSLQYSFSIELKNDLDFSAWWAQGALKEGSNILITNQKNSFEASATLNGALYIKSDIPNLPDLTLAHLTFSGMEISSKGGFDPGFFKAGLGGGDQAQLIPDNNDTDALYAYATAQGGPNPSAYYTAEMAETAETAQTGENSQSSLMGFNFNVDGVGPYLSGAKVGLQFNTRMQLVNNANFIPKADLQFAIYADMSQKGKDGRKWWSSGGADLKGVKLEADANLAGMKISGSITYFDLKNPYKDRGFSGELSVLLPSMEGAGISMKGLFGTRIVEQKYIQYFYIDGAVDLGAAAIPIFTGVKLYGFAGGAYYNMTQTIPDSAKDPNSDIKVKKGEDPGYDNMTSFSGVVYKPINSNDRTLGFLAGVYIGLTERKVFEAEASLDMKFSNGSFNQIVLQGRGAFVNGGESTFNEKYVNALGRAEVGINVQFDEGTFKQFDLTSKVNIQYPNTNSILTANADFHFHVNSGNKWFIKIGSPNENERVGVKIGFKGVAEAEFGSYFQCGNHKIDPMPPVPGWIISIIDGGESRSEERSRFDNTASRQIPQNHVPGVSRSDTGKGVIFGSALEFKLDPEFLIFYAHLRAGLGFDFSLMFSEKPLCENSSGSNWYALGQAFMGAEAACGVKVNVFGIRKDIEFLSAGLAATVKAGMPDPVFAQGKLGGYFSVLGGLLQKNFRISFSLGEVCQLAGNPEELKLISDMQPEKGETEVSMSARPAVVFNFPVGKPFVLPIDYQEGEDFKTRYRIFLIDSECTSISLSGGTHNFTGADFKRLGGPLSRDYGYLFDAQTLLTPLTKYTFHVESKVKIADLSFESKNAADMAAGAGAINIGTSKKELGYNYVIAEDTRQHYVDKRTVTFETGEGYKVLPEELVTEITPYPRSRSRVSASSPLTTLYLPTSRGQIKFTPLENPIDEKSFITKDTGNDLELWARVVNASTGASVDNKITCNGHVWTFAMPKLQRRSLYVVKIYLINKAAGQSDEETPSTVLKTIKRYRENSRLWGWWLPNQKETQVKERRLSALKHLQISDAKEKEVYKWYFTTSGADNYVDKFRGMKIKKIEILGEPNSKGGKDIHEVEKTIWPEDSKTVNLGKLDWENDEDTKTISVKGFRLYYHVSPQHEAFNEFDIYTLPRNWVLKPEEQTMKNIYWPKRMRDYLGIRQLYDDKNRFQNMLNEFSKEAFGSDKVLELDITGEEYRQIWGGLYTGYLADESFPSLTEMMSADMTDEELVNMGVLIGQYGEYRGEKKEREISTGSTTTTPGYTATYNGNEVNLGSMEINTSQSLKMEGEYDYVIAREFRSTGYSDGREATAAVTNPIADKIDAIIQYANVGYVPIVFDNVVYYASLEPAAHGPRASSEGYTEQTAAPQPAVPDTNPMRLDRKMAARGKLMDKIHELLVEINTTFTLPEGLEGPKVIFDTGSKKTKGKNKR